MTFLFRESSEEVSLRRRERRLLTPLEAALLDEGGVLSVVDGMPIDPVMTVDAVEEMLFSDAGNSVSLVISLSCTEFSESAPLESSRISWIRPTSICRPFLTFCQIILVTCPTASNYSRIILANFSTYSPNYAGIIGTGHRPNDLLI